MKQHILKNKREKYPCTICDSTFLSKQGLKEHIQIIHEGMKRYFCKLCNKGFYNYNNLDDHIRFHHTKEKPFNCKLCKYSTFTSAYFSFHVKRVHTEWKFGCYFCEKRFWCFQKMREHMCSVHLLEKM